MEGYIPLFQATMEDQGGVGQKMEVMHLMFLGMPFKEILVEGLVMVIMVGLDLVEAKGLEVVEARALVVESVY